MKVKNLLIAAMLGFGTTFSGVTFKSNLITEKEKTISFVPNIISKEDIAKKTSMSIPIYAKRDCWIFSEPTFKSSTTPIKIGTKIYAYAEIISKENIRYFILENGYAVHDDFVYDKDYVFYNNTETLYAKEATKIFDIPNNLGVNIKTLDLNDEVVLNGCNEKEYCQINGINGYVKKSSLMKEKYYAPTPAPTQTTQTYSYTPTGNGHLTPSAGVFYGPSGKETYYNLPMGGVIAIAQAAGIQGNYWERSDGAKMYGNYIMCACGFTVRPRGTIVETSLGPGICLDTGGFAENDPYQIDLAVTWN